MKLDFFCASNNELATIQQQLSCLEKNFTYPFGKDRFRICHGNDYFAFFNNMGKVFCLGYKVGDKIIASAVCILRNINNELVWYFADLKVYSKIENINLIHKLKQDAFSFLYKKSNKFYAINMNSQHKKNGIIAKVLNRGLPLKIEYSHDLAIYLLNLQQLNFCINTIFNYNDMISLQGKKDLILQNTGSRIPLIHLKLQSNCSKTFKNNKYLQPNNKFMFCSLMQNKLQQQLTKNNIFPIATAALIHSGMRHCDWGFINTYEL
jgi:hypothetical protein